MSLYVRPSRLEYEMHNKVKELLKMYPLTPQGIGAGSTINGPTSAIYVYLLGAQNALNLLSGSGIEQRDSFFRALDKITGMVLENHQVYIEEKS